MKMTVFIRILMATLLPVLLVIIIVVSTARVIIQADGSAYTREFTRLAAKQISELTAIKLRNAATLQNKISRELANIDFTCSQVAPIADRWLDTLLLSNPDIYCTWFAFEPGIFTENARYSKAIMQVNGESAIIPVLTEALLNNPEASPWYSVPFQTGKIYANVNDAYDYGVGEGTIRTFTMTYPVLSMEGQAIGCVGLDIRYEVLFSQLSSAREEAQRIMLTSQQGEILFSSESADIGNSLWDYGFQKPDQIMKEMLENKIWQEDITSPFSNKKLTTCLYPVNIEHIEQTIYLYCEIPVQNLYKPFYSSMEAIIVVGSIGMILLTFSVFFSTRDIVKHVKRITESFNYVANDSAEGTLDGEHIPITQTNIIELDVLQSALVKMMMQLRWAHGHKLKALEADVEREKLIASAEAKTNFFAAMSHEIRTPMNAIIGISEIMLHEGKLSQPQEKYMQDIKISADALLNIINDILDISKLETGKMELHPEHYNFRTLMDNVASLGAHLAAEANLRFIFKPDGEMPLCLYGDGMRLRQVLLNLIGNAIKFTRKGYVMLRVSIREDKIRFSVIDSGIGIKKSEIGLIFESFKCLDTKHSWEVKGTGLGLPISKNLIEIMGGTMEVESIYGSGSTFTIILPLILGNEEKLQNLRPHMEVRYSKALRVLLVDDDNTNLNVSSGLMRAAHGILCDAAASGREAISRVLETDYDIIFMDHMMPDLDGLDTTQHIRQLGEKYKKIPIIALTANAVIGTREELINGGMNDFLSKPIQSEKLSEILSAWVPEDKRLPAEIDEESKTAEPDAPRLKTLSDSTAESCLREGGVDTYAGMKNIGFDEKMYRQSLRLLMERLPHLISLFHELLEKEDMQDFYIHVHGLKGSLASIGAIQLSDEAKNLESEVAEDNIQACRCLLPPLTKNLWKLYEAFRKTFPSKETCEGVENAGINSSMEIIKPSLQKLCDALSSYNYELIMRELGAVFTLAKEPGNNGVLSKIRVMIENFDYAGAAALIHDLLSAEGDT